MKLDQFINLGKSAVVVATMVIGGLAASSNASAQVSQHSYQQPVVIQYVTPQVTAAISQNGVNKGNRVQTPSVSAVQANINRMRANSYRTGTSAIAGAHMEGSNYVGNESGIEGVDFNRSRIRR